MRSFVKTWIGLCCCLLCYGGSVRGFVAPPQTFASQAHRHVDHVTERWSPSFTVPVVVPSPPPPSGSSFMKACSSSEPDLETGKKQFSWLGWFRTWWWRPLWRAHRGILSATWRRRIAGFIMATMLLFGGDAALAAVTGGRAGGTFSSQSQSSSRVHSYPTRSYSSGARCQQRLPRVVYTTPAPPLFYNHHRQSTAIRTTTVTPLSKKDILILGSVAGLFAYGLMANGSRHGPNDEDEAFYNTTGATATAMLLALQIPNRHAPDSIISRINSIAQSTDTDTVEGVQSLVADVCLELVRQQASIVASWTDSRYSRSTRAAMQAFQERSVINRSRYDEETFSKFNAVEYPSTPSLPPAEADGKATMAVVTVNYVTQGEDSNGFQNMRADVVNLLRWTAATVPVSTLLAGEVLWSPQRTSDTLSQQDLDERYPELTPII